MALLSGLIKAEELDEEDNVTLAQLWGILRELFSSSWRDYLSEGLYFTVECQEDIAFQNPQKVFAGSATVEDFYRNSFNDGLKDIYNICKSAVESCARVGKICRFRATFYACACGV
ncbi:MAG: hypothetical protein R2880_18615 [Deinococcales bacterium]